MTQTAKNLQALIPTLIGYDRNQIGYVQALANPRATKKLKRDALAVLISRADEAQDYQSIDWLLRYKRIVINELPPITWGIDVLKKYAEPTGAGSYCAHCGRQQEHLGFPAADYCCEILHPTLPRVTVEER